MHRLLTLTLLLAFLLLAGCETMSGLGRDLQKAGNWVEKEATK